MNNSLLRYNDHISQAQIQVKITAQSPIQAQEQSETLARKHPKNQKQKIGKDEATDNVDSSITISAFSYPEFSKTADYKTPDFILTKVINSQLKVQLMVWDGGKRDFEYVGKVAKDLETNTKSKVKKPLDFLKTSRPRTLTCMDVHDIWAFDNLISENTIAVILEIISMTNSNFHSVEPIHLPIVYNSMINGKFCSYHAVNPQLNLVRGLKVSIEPTRNNRASEVFKAKWTSAIDDCVKGPVKSNLKPLALPNDYYKLFKLVKSEGSEESGNDEGQDSDRFVVFMDVIEDEQELGEMEKSILMLDVNN